MNDQKAEKKQGRKPVPNLVITERLRNLIDTQKSRQTIAAEIGCDVSTITKHYNGNNPVDLEMLFKYAKYFNVSTDYLLGISDISSTDIEVKAICQKIGCPESTFNLLCEYFGINEQLEGDDKHDLTSTLNAFIMTALDGHLLSATDEYQRAKASLDYHTEQKEMPLRPGTNFATSLCTMNDKAYMELGEFSFFKSMQKLYFDNLMKWGILYGKELKLIIEKEGE